MGVSDKTWNESWTDISQVQPCCRLRLIRKGKAKEKEKKERKERTAKAKDAGRQSGKSLKSLGNDIRRSMAKGKMHETWLNGFYKCTIFWHMWDIAPFVEYTWYHLTSLLFFHVAWTWKNPSVPVLGVSRWYLIEWTWGTTWILWPWDLERSMQNTSKYCANDV